MAQRNSSGSRKSSKNSRSSGKRGSSSAGEFKWTKEVVLFAVIIFAVIIFLGMIGFGGAVGDMFADFFSGIFGIMAYIFPFFIVFSFIFVAANFTGENKTEYTGHAILRIVGFTLIFVFLCGIIYIFSKHDDVNTVIDAFKASSASRTGGGALGYLIGGSLTKGMGSVLSVIICLLILALGVIFIIERSLFRALTDRKIDEEKRRQKQQQREEKRRTRAENARIAREERAARQNAHMQGDGVSYDTKLEPHDPGDNMREIPWKTDDDASAAANAVYSEDIVDAVISDDLPDAGFADKTSVSQTRKRTSGKKAAEVSNESLDINTSSYMGSYVFPDINNLKRNTGSGIGDSKSYLAETSKRLQLTLDNFGVNAKVTNVVSGPSVTQFEIRPEIGVKVSKIVGLSDDIKLNLAVEDIRIEAPIPGKSTIGIEVPNKEISTVGLRELVESNEFKSTKSKIAFCVGKDIAGDTIIADIAEMPHVLIAGATGSGKSVCINTIIMSILYNATPDEVKLILIDPKIVELSVYNGIPHLMIPVVTDPKKAAGALQWAVAEMTERYQKFAESGVRDLKGYNEKVDFVSASMSDEEGEKPERMPQIVIIVDEMADLMMVASGEVEEAICRLAQLARACGIHLVLATQRPSVNVITGLIKANMPSRIAFAVTSGVDSRTILDMNGAEKLLGKGDMLFYPQGYSKPLRVQGAFVSSKEVASVVKDICEKNGKTSYDTELEEKMGSAATAEKGMGLSNQGSGRDEYFADAGRFLIEKEKGSIGMLQRMFRIGFNRAARIMDQLEEEGVVGPEEGTKPRKIIMTLEEFEEHLKQNN